MKKAIKIVTSICFIFTLCFIVLEIFFRIYNPFQARLKHNKIVLPINRRYGFYNTKIGRLDKEIINHKNAIGFRGKNPPEDFNNFLTVIAVGGSTTECFYLSDGKTWPDLLEQKLKGSYDNVWLNNAGLAGHSTFGHIMLLSDYIADLRPKIVLLMVGANDRGRNDLNKYDKVTFKGYYSSFKNFIAKNSEAISALSSLLRVFKAEKLGVTHKNVDVAKLSKLPLPDEYVNKVLQKNRELYIGAYKKRLVKLIDLSRENVIDPIFITQPMLYGDRVDSSTGVYLGAVKVLDNINGILDWKILELYNDATNDVATSKGVFLIDLAKQMPKDSRYFYDNWHCTNEGAEKIAQIIYDDLTGYLDRKYRVFKKR